MTSNESWRRLLDAGAAVGQATLARANDLAKGLVAEEPEVRERARRDLDELGRAGRRFGGQLAEVLRRGLAETLGHETGALDTLADLFDDLLARRPPEHDGWRAGADERSGPGTPGAPSKGPKGKDKPKKGAPKAKANARRSGSDGGGSAKGSGKRAKRREHRASGPAPERP